MKAVVQDRYGAPADVLTLEETEEPAIGATKVLVRVHAASIHIGDTFGIRGVPYLFRPTVGLRHPRVRVPGTDVAGTIDAVGAEVAEFAPGDEVPGWGTGAFAEMAAIGVSAMTAPQALRDQGTVEAGQKVLINGASGGVGTFAVQITKAFGTEVTGVCSARNTGMVRLVRADHAVDDEHEVFTQGTERYDFILDSIGNHSMSETRRARTPTGWSKPLGHFARAGISSIFVVQQLRPFDAAPSREDLAQLVEMTEAGKLRPVIERTYALADGPSAVAHVAEGHSQGTTVISMRPAQA